MSEKTLEGMVEAALDRNMSRGDLESQERGSGARADAGKPSWGLMPLTQLLPLLNDGLINESPNPKYPITLGDCVYHLAYFQRSGEGAEDLLRHSIAYLMDEMNVDFWGACEEVIRVWEHGEKKYASFNWMKGMSWNSIIGCYMRHVRKIRKGTIIDEESGRHHGAHLVCNAMMLVHYARYYPEGNDLPIRWYKEIESEPSIRSGHS
jgi:hypothetical protein